MAEETARNDWREHALLGVFYAGFFIVVFSFAAYLTFPYDRLRYLLMAKASAPAEAGSGGRTLQIGELSPYGLSGVELKDVELVQAAVAPADPPKVVRLAELSVSISPFALLFGERKVDVEAEVGTGSLEAQLVQSSSGQHIEVELDGVDVNELGLGSYIGLPIKGSATGKIDFTMPTEVPKSSGDVKLQIKGLHIGDGKAKIKLPGMAGSGLTLDEVQAGKLDLAIQIQNGLATITKLSTDGKDLKLDGKGTLRLVDPMRRSRPDLNLELKFAESFKNKSDRTRAMFDLIGMRPEWQSATGPDGTMKVHVTGTLQSMRGTPQR